MLPRRVRADVLMRTDSGFSPRPSEDEQPLQARKVLRRAELASLRRVIASAPRTLRDDEEDSLLAEMAGAVDKEDVVSRATFIAILCQERTLQTKRGVAALRQQQNGALVHRLAEERFATRDVGRQLSYSSSSSSSPSFSSRSSGKSILQEAVEWDLPPCAFLRVLVVDGLGVDRKTFSQWLKCPALLDALTVDKETGSAIPGETEIEDRQGDTADAATHVKHARHCQCFRP